MQQLTIRRRPRDPFAALLIVVMAVSIAGPPLWQLADGLRGGAFPTLENPSLRSIEEALNDRSPLVRWAQRHWAPLTDRLLHRGSSQVLRGADGWLFYRDAVSTITAPSFDAPRARRILGLPADGGPGPRAAILDFARQLAAREVRLLLLPVPVKATVVPQRLWPAASRWSAPRNPGVAGLLEDLSRQGVIVVDPLEPLLDLERRGIAAFLARDTHWSPAGMHAAAKLVATRIRELGLQQALGGPTPFDHRRAAFWGDGDLTTMLAAEGAVRRFPPLGVLVEQVIGTIEKVLPIGRDATVLLLGDSLTNVFSVDELGLGQRGGFAEHLAAQLQRPVDVIAMPGGGASRTRETLALRPNGLAGKRLVVWQLTERDLLFSRDGWRLVEMPLSSEEPGLQETPSGMEQRVRAELLATTELPATFDYSECVILTRFRRLDDGVPPSGDLLVAFWGWRKWKTTAAARLRPGAIVDLQLRPVASAVDLESTCWIDDVGVDRPPFWGVLGQ